MDGAVWREGGKVNYTWRELNEARKREEREQERFRFQMIALGITVLVWIAFELVTA
jgi:hypothetical protein